MGKNKIEIGLKELLILFFSIVILIVSIVVKSDKLLIGVFVVWIMMMIYAFTDIYNHIVLFFTYHLFLFFNRTRNMFCIFWIGKILYIFGTLQ